MEIVDTLYGPAKPKDSNCSPSSKHCHTKAKCSNCLLFQHCHAKSKSTMCLLYITSKQIWPFGFVEQNSVRSTSDWNWRYILLLCKPKRQVLLHVGLALKLCRGKPNTVSAYFACKQIRYCILALQEIAKLHWFGDLHRDVCGVQCFVLFCWQEHFVDVMRNQEFVLLPMDEVSKLLCSDDLNVPSEETIFHALVMWAKHEAISRRKHLARLLAHIKLPLLQPQVSHTQASSHRKARLLSRSQTRSATSGEAEPCGVKMVIPGIHVMLLYWTEKS